MEGALRSSLLARHFDLRPLEVLDDRLIEVSGPRASLARFLIDNGFDYALGAVALDLADGGRAAASAARLALERSPSPDDFRLIPYRPLQLEALALRARMTPPAPLRQWLNLGAWVCGEPADGGRAAILPMLLPLARMRGREARSFLRRAA